MPSLARRIRGRVLATAITILIGSATSAFAQDTTKGLTFGAALGAASTGNSWSGGAGGQTAATQLDLGVSHVLRIRLDAELIHWSPDNDPQGDIPVRAGNVWLSRVGMTALHYRDSQLGSPEGLYTGWGVARYRYFIQHGHVSSPTSIGIHGLVGYEHFRPAARWGFHVEGGIRFVGGPGHNQVWANTLPMLSARVGLNRRF